MIKTMMRGLEKISASLDVELNYSHANHNFELGLPLENALKTFFRPYFPGRYGFASGYMVDAAGSVSNQTDWIIYDAIYAHPLIPKTAPIDNVEWLPFDGVYGFIEVKRTLDEDTLRKAIKQLAKSKSLLREPSSLLRSGPYFDLTGAFNIGKDRIDKANQKTTNQIYSGIYAYKEADNSALADPSMALRYIGRLKNEFSYDELPEFLAVHGKYYIKKTSWSILEDNSHHYDMSCFINDCNSYSLFNTMEKTAGFFYVDLLSKFANTTLNLSYQTSLLKNSVDSIFDAGVVTGIASNMRD